MRKDESETILVGISDLYDSDSWTFTVPDEDGSNGWIDLLNPENTITDTTSVKLDATRRIIIWKKK